MDPIQRIQERIEPLRDQLLQHPVYRKIDSIEAIQTLMEHHVFAVWDFMSLLKKLQLALCPPQVPWVPPSHRAGARMINEIVLGEETDEDGRGGFASHFDLYHRAMLDCGASTTIIDEFLVGIGQGRDVSEVLRLVQAPDAVVDFVQTTFAIIDSDNLPAIASAFTFGREDLLPDVFRKIVERLDAESDQSLCEMKYYLDRHIDLDEDTHGPMAIALLHSLCGDDATAWQAASDAAVRSLKARIRLWDAVDVAITERSSRSEPALKWGA